MYYRALANFKFWENYIFYIYLVKCFILLLSIKRGITLDKKDKEAVKEREIVKKLEERLMKS